MSHTKPSRVRTMTVAVLFTVLSAISGIAGQVEAQTTQPSAQPSAASNAALAALAKQRIDSAEHLYTAADVNFMTGMIGHHAQAITMSRMAATHGASPSVQILASRIINAQQDEIGTMQQWLRERGKPVPDPMAGMAMDMPGMDMSGGKALMPGMLTDPQMKALDAARGTEFDRLFLTGMMQHHRGALTMVKELFGSYGAGQDEQVFKFANDVNVDQTTEIARMEKMLFMLQLQNPAP